MLLEREHVWGPTPDAAVDELLAEIAWTWSPGTGGGGGGGTPLVPSETVLYAVRNASNSVVGFVDQTGTPAAIFEYTPYGELTLAQGWSVGGGRRGWCAGCIGVGVAEPRRASGVVL